MGIVSLLPSVTVGQSIVELNLILISILMFMGVRDLFYFLLSKMASAIKSVSEFVYVYNVII